MLKNYSIKFIIILFFIISVIFTYSQNSDGIEIKRFCRKYGFRLRVRLKKQELILKKDTFKIKLLAESTIAITNSNKVWFLKNPVRIRKSRVILPNSLVRRLTSKADQMNTNYQSNQYENKRDNFSHFNTHKDQIQFLVLDAGHGGKDPGNTYSGLQEKKINLQITRKVYRKLKSKYPKLKIVLTRTNDKYISLEQRSLQAINLTSLNHQGLFVSIHSNASLNRRAKGIETFFYSSKPGSNSQERIKCFRSLTKSISPNPLAHKIITKMYDYQISRESQILAREVNQSIYKKLKWATLNRGVKAHQPYFVITHNNLPSILVEVGFLSNSKEAKRLSTSGYQNKVAEGISEGIYKFISQFNQTKGFVE